MSEKLKWLIYGFIFGLLFPSMAVLIDYFIINSATVSLITMIKSSPLHWIIMSAPLVIGTTFTFIGKGRDRLLGINKELQDMNSNLEGVSIKQQSKLNATMEELSLYTKQLEDVINNVDEAICIIDNNFNIELGYNSIFTQIFGDRDYRGSSIFDMVFYNLDEKMKGEAVDFLKTAFNSPASTDEILNAANPISEFTYLFNQEGTFKPKTLDSNIIRIRNKEGNIEKLMIVFKDLTFVKELKEEIEQKEQVFQDELSIITVLLKNDKDVVISFVNDLKERMKNAHTILDTMKLDSINNQAINSLQGIVHSIKGEAFALGFKKLADVSGNTESLLKQIINKKVTFEKNIQILEHIEKLNGESEKLHSLVNKLFSFAGHSKLTERERISLSPANYIKLVNSFNEILNHFRDDSLKEDKLVQLQNLIQRLDWLDLLILEKALTQVNEKSAVENNKNSKLNIIYDIDSMPLEKFRLLRESLIHLIRNSIAHGIEEPTLRSAKKKDEAGKINIHIYKDDKNYNVLYTDDGAGFNIKKIKQKAIENKLATEDVLRTLSEKETIKFVFNDSFSTSEKTDVLSGVGAGMAVVRNNILNILKGKLELTNRPGRGISIKIVFPA